MTGYEALRQSAARVDLSARGRIRVSGEDRKRLLHAMTTNHVEQLEPGQAIYAFFLNAQGRILADVNIYCAEDHLLLSVEPEVREKVLSHLDRYIIADDVTLEDITEATAEIAVSGPQAPAPPPAPSLSRAYRAPTSLSPPGRRTPCWRGCARPAASKPLWRKPASSA
jgi:glycine cleavage system aminomethyltransferase T